MEDNESNKKMLLNFTLYTVSNVVVYALIMFIVLGSLGKLSDMVELSDNGY